MGEIPTTPVVTTDLGWKMFYYLKPTFLIQIFPDSVSTRKRTLEIWKIVVENLCYLPETFRENWPKALKYLVTFVKSPFSIEICIKNHKIFLIYFKDFICALSNNANPYTQVSYFSLHVQIYHKILMMLNYPSLFSPKISGDLSHFQYLLLDLSQFFESFDKLKKW